MSIKEIQHNVDIENEVLATAFLSSENVKKILRTCQETDFFSTFNRNFFQTMKKMRAAGKHIEPVSITVEMGPKEFGYQIGKLAGHGLTDVFLDQHLEQLKTLSLRRKLQTIQADATHEEIKLILAEADIQSNLYENSSVLSSEEVREQTKKYYSKGNDKGVSTGFNNLDQYFTISKKQQR